MTDQILSVVGFVVLLVLLFASSVHLYQAPSGLVRFENSYANANQRIVECLFWCIRHLRKALTEGAVRQRVARAALASWIAVSMIILSVLIVIRSDAPSLDGDGIAAAAGALIWSCVLESVSLPERTQRLAGIAVVGVPVWFLAILLTVADLLLLLVTAAGWFGSGAAEAGAVGASFVALADLTSFAFGLALAAQSPQSLLIDP
jgi:hypothetical protein